MPSLNERVTRLEALFDILPRLKPWDSGINGDCWSKPVLRLLLQESMPRLFEYIIFIIDFLKKVKFSRFFRPFIPRLKPWGFPADYPN
jgi:hypothetical protein